MDELLGRDCTLYAGRLDLGALPCIRYTFIVYTCIGYTPLRAAARGGVRPYEAIVSVLPLDTICRLEKRLLDVHDYTIEYTMWKDAQFEM